MNVQHNLSSVTLAISAAVLCLPTHAADCDPSIADGAPTGIPSFSDISAPAGVLKCAGFYTGNVNSGNAADLATVQSLLASPSWASYGLTTTGRIEQINVGSSPIDFATPLSGLTLVAFHWGNFGESGNPAGNVSAFYLFNAGASLDTFVINQTQGLSNAAIWAMAPIPEPSSYALLLAGLGAVGFVARRRRPQT